MILRYIVRRLLIAVVQAISIVLLVFVLIRSLPADPVSRLVGGMATPEIYNAVRAKLGLDQPILTQLITYIGLRPTHEPGLLQGNLGNSWATGSPVLEEVIHFFPITFELLIISFAIALMISIPVGMIAALRPGKTVDKAVFTYGLFAGSQPEFWWGLFFIFIFYATLHLVPAPIGRLDPLTAPVPAITHFLLIDILLEGRSDLFVEALLHYILPVGTLVFITSGPIIKMTRQTMLKVLQSPFILYARACGLPDLQIALYTLRNAFAPIMTLFAFLMAFLLGGAVLVETVFSWGGLGQYSVRAILNLDFPAIQGVILVITIYSLLVYLLLDVFQALLDPRVVLE
jgi:ABC-type dipeptide/oligopeptide/nickel transport system permease component